MFAFLINHNMPKTPAKKNSEKVKIPLAEGDYLTRVKYYSGNPQPQRQTSLRKAVDKFGYKPIVLRLNATAIRLKNAKPQLSSNIREDMQWLKGVYRPNRK
mmetsp:Transcript_2806/g.4355  ORF Transcript_2806/g.4355 Transcript_2806/m.4355 type:complete len:101 (+) Transcript_2806:1323-1625(+)